MKTVNGLQDIPTNKNYEGYLWWSDQQKPDVYDNQPIVSQLDKPIWPESVTNPFIIEGNLWDNDNKISYLIRFIDGQYLVYKFELKGISKDQITKHKYLPNRMPGIDKLKFKEVWEEQPDEFCNGFNVLKPAFIAFVGFEKQEEKQ